MADVHAKNHDYHLVDPSPWPFVGSVSAFVLAIGAVHYMKGGAPWILIAGFAGVLYTMIAWWRDVINEAHRGDHTRVVAIHLRYGMILFIASEVMFFVACSGPISTSRCSRTRRISSRVRNSSAASGRPRASRPSTPGTCRC